jgi:opacity protein-like surface antigen
MSIGKLVLAGTVAVVVAGSAAVAQQHDQTGQVTRVNRLNNTISIRPLQNGTVGADTAGSEQEFKVKDGLSLEDLHAGNDITYSTTGSDGNMTITKFNKMQ